MLYIDHLMEAISCSNNLIAQSDLLSNGFDWKLIVFNELQILSHDIIQT